MQSAVLEKNMLKLCGKMRNICENKAIQKTWKKFRPEGEFVSKTGTAIISYEKNISFFIGRKWNKTQEKIDRETSECTIRKFTFYLRTEKN